MISLLADVSDALRQVAQDTVMPVYQQQAAAPEEMEPREWVTTADRGAEAMLTPMLSDLVPGSLVVGEEATHADAGVLDRLSGHGAVWLVDPLDGTANFAAGRPPFRLMVALVEAGASVASWVYDPISDEMATAVRGEGAFLDGRRVATAGRTPGPEAMRGAVLRRFLPPDVSARVDAGAPRLSEVLGGSGSAGADYVDLALGRLDFALYWRTLPWDHLPGALFLHEAGGLVRRTDGSHYTAADHARPGLLAATDPDTWATAHAVLLAAE